MESPVYRRGSWWQRNDDGWHEWGKTWSSRGTWDHKPLDKFPFPPPPRSPFRLTINSEPFLVYLVGVLSAIAALGVTIAFVPEKYIAAVLAPVMAVIGTFTGHAAGHSSAINTMRETKAK